MAPSAGPCWESYWNGESGRLWNGAAEALGRLFEPGAGSGQSGKGTLIQRVVSGGQTGADRIGLEVAAEFGIPTGGWAPEDWMTESGPDPELGTAYGLKTLRGGYRERTQANVRDSDCTLFLVWDPESVGTKLATRTAVHFGRPYLIYDLSVNPGVLFALGFLSEVRYGRPGKAGGIVLNVAGNRLSGSPGWFSPIARSVLRGLFGAVVSAEAADGQVLGAARNGKRQ